MNELMMSIIVISNDNKVAACILPYGGKLWQRENLANSLHEHIGGRKFGEL